MVTRKRLRSFLTALGLYVLAALLIGYFGVNAYTRQPRAQGQAGHRPADRRAFHELAGCKVERAQWERRIALLKSDGLDPDMLDERARALLDYTHPNDLTLMLDRAPAVADRRALNSTPSFPK